MLLTFYHLIHEWASVRHSCFLNPLNPYKLQSHLTKDVSKIYQQSSVFDSWPMIYKIVIGAWYFFWNMKYFTSTMLRVNQLHRMYTCNKLPIRSIAWLEISLHGWGGYINDAFWICSLISSSSLNGKVPDKLTWNWNMWDVNTIFIQITQ